MAKTKAAAPQTVGREPPAPRMPERDPGVERSLAADPNGPILTRSGKPATLKFTGAEDKFSFDRSIIPEGWDYQWKTKTIKNWEWIDHQVELAQNGWEPVPAERHPGVFMPKDYRGPIERGGMILMERDMRLTAQARRVERREANEQLAISRSMAGLMGNQITGSGAAILDFDAAEAKPATGVKIERTPRVNDAKYTYTLDE